MFKVTLLDKATNAPISGTPLELQVPGAFGLPPITAITDAQGVATFNNLPSGHYSLGLSGTWGSLPPNYSPNPVNISVTDTGVSPMDVTVYVTNGDPSPQPPVTKTVSITLLNKDTNAPTPWTEFMLVSNSSSNPMAISGVTDDQGIATFTDVPVGDYSLMAQFGRPLPSNYSPNQLTISLSETSESPLNFTIYETPSALESVTLKLTDKETGTPIVGAMFDYYYFDGQSYVKGNQDMGSFSTDSNGEIKFKDFIPEGQDPFMYPPDYLRGSKDTIYFVQVSAIEGYVKADG